MISVGSGPENPSSDSPKTYPNPLKEARRYKQLLDEGQATSQADLARSLGVSRAKVTQMLNLLKLDEEIQEFVLNLDDTDERLRVLTERKLRVLARIADKRAQGHRFWRFVE